MRIFCRNFVVFCHFRVLPLSLFLFPFLRWEEETQALLWSGEPRPKKHERGRNRLNKSRPFSLFFPFSRPLSLLCLPPTRQRTGHAWVSDYGSPGNKDDFAVLRSYSPIHNVCRPADGGQYPAVMITTGDHDDRVVPLHSHKLTATLQYVLCGGREEEKEEEKDGEKKNKDGASPPPQKNPIITRIDVRAGHGAGKPTDKVIAEVSDMFAFAAEVVGAEWKGDGVV